MKNKEMYREQIMNYTRGDFCIDFIRPVILGKANCDDMRCDQCRLIQAIWLEDEYKEPEVDWYKIVFDTPKVDWSKVAVDTPIEVSADGKNGLMDISQELERKDMLVLG